MSFAPRRGLLVLPLLLLLSLPAQGRELEVAEAGVTSVTPAPFYSVFEVEEIGV
jgi:hypothetical protein